MRTGVANLPLHPGKCPRWLFPRMRDLSGAIIEAIALEFGSGEVLRRLSDPFFFQSLGCVVGFDWHSSGLTTTLCGAMKEGVHAEATGIAVLGGKGKASKKTPEEIEKAAETFPLSSKKAEELKRASRMAAKVDSACVQDGYHLYHHTFVVSELGEWCVIQQGMNSESRYARRYHWLSEAVLSFVNEPHAAVCCDAHAAALNMVAVESNAARTASVELVKEKPERIVRALLGSQSFLADFLSPATAMAALQMQRRHDIPQMDKRTLETLCRAYEVQPTDYEELLSVPGVGPKTVRSLALIGQIVYGAEPSWRDPTKFAFAHGGKDGVPYPVDRSRYDRSIEMLRSAVQDAKLGEREKMMAMKRLAAFF